MIPKIIHYCWFGNGKLDELSKACIDGWHKVVPDYKIILWNESNFDVNAFGPFVQKAYESKKWAFVTDYVRAWALYHYGGVYLDADVELKHDISGFLHHGAFSSFESTGLPFTALWAAEAGHPWPKKVLDYYDQKSEFEDTINTTIVSDILVNDYKVDRFNDSLQLLKDNVAIYPSSYFCVDLPVNYACHHFNGSWVKDGHNKKLFEYKRKVSMLYHREAAIKALGENELIKTISFKVVLLEIPKRIFRVINQNLFKKK